MVGTATTLSLQADAALTELQQWAQTHAGPADSKAEHLIAELERICRPDGKWNDERVVVFTEYRDTQVWLAGILGARGLGGDRLGLLHGGLEEKRREHLKAAFQAAPDPTSGAHPARHRRCQRGHRPAAHCHRVIHYDIPFNPNRLEQRIGRVDRFGQTKPVHVAHFVGAGWQQAGSGSFEDDLEFLSRVAAKVAQEREDLGRVNPVLARAVESRMLGRPILDDPFATQPGTTLIRAEKDLTAQVARLREQLRRSTDTLHVAPANIRRVVDTALRLAAQPPMIDLGDGLVDAPALTRGWERTLEGLHDPLDLDRQRPMTFDGAHASPDVVHAHLGSRLVDQSQRLLRSAVWGEQSALTRVGGVVAALPDEIRTDEMLVAVVTRLVLVGADGARLHEEVLLAARAVPPSGRSRRVEVEERRFEAIRDAVEAALEPDACQPVQVAAAQRLTDGWDELRLPLAGDIAARAAVRKAALERNPPRARSMNEPTVDAITSTCDAPDRCFGRTGPRARLDQLDLDQTERRQVDADRAAWRARLDGLENERLRERDTVERRYRGVRELTFPVAVVLVTRAETP